MSTLFIEYTLDNRSRDASNGYTITTAVILRLYKSNNINATLKSSVIFI